MEGGTEEARSLARREFVWSIRIQRLCATAAKDVLDGYKEENQRTSRAEAIEYIAKARKWANRQIKRAIEYEEMTEEEAKEARKELAKIAKETKRQADGLPE